MLKPLLISIVGPTAVGKTAISIELARYFKSIILSADSRQFYKEMNIGTAKPTDFQLSLAHHEFINNKSICDFYSVGDYEREVLLFLGAYFQKHPIAFLVGGSGLFVDAVLHGLDDLPQAPEELRRLIMEEVRHSGLEPLWAELAIHDPIYYQTVDLKNTQRVVRAIEVIRHTGEPFSSFLKGDAKERLFDVVKIGIEADRALLYETINRRVDEMLEAGLVEEARSFLPQKDLYALQTVGYQELFECFEGKCSLEEAIELIKRNTRRFAKRPLTWFRRDTDIVWFKNNDVGAIIEFLKVKIER